ncbi:MAG: hypothetical protein COU51_00210 [Parcubacteria group bacterium CG10_big_fil_rev_8_21_14_0_10_36_14]|nr:MAG: hypothetical protein COU51_00210 [Parcubacteria group bacterium CG10_big_fil_rev_8_21_14_0_10_36_14]
MQGVLGAIVLFIVATFIAGIATEGNKSNHAGKRRYRYVVKYASHSPYQPINFNKYSIGRASVRKRRGVVATQLHRFQHILQESPEAVKQILAASESAGVPVDVALAHWAQESFMSLSGDSGTPALTAIERNIREDRRRRGSFIKNKQAFLNICQKCGYYKKYGTECRQLKGSSTGALGSMQFMPYTWGDPSNRRDLDGDGVGCPLNLAEAFYATAEKLRGHADFARQNNNNWRVLPAKEHIYVLSPIPSGLLENEWDFAMLRYAGEYCSRNYAYVKRAKLLRPHLCGMIREATGQKLDCSMEPSAFYLASN